MIKKKKYEIKISKKNSEWLKNKGYIFNQGDIIIINTEDLPEGSHKKIHVKCDICGNEKEIMFQKYIKNIKNGGFYACSSKCAQEKVKNTTNKKYGSDYYMQTEEYTKRVKETSLKNYGVEHFTQSDEVKQNQEKTCLKKFGKKTYLQCEDYKIKMKDFLGEYDNVFQMEEIKEKSRKTMMKNYGVEYFTQSSEWVPHSGITSISYGENKLLEFIKENYNGKIIINNRIILKPYELDIYLPNLNLAFEFNGLYWHNEINKPEKKYHLNKTENCLKQGIQLIHIWEDDWENKLEIVKSMILNKLNLNTKKLMARKCEIKEITDNFLIKDFLNKNHLQGFVGSRVKIGLFYEGKLVSLMTFGKKRLFMKSKSKTKNEYELLRFCNKLNTTVIGGASRLFKYFTKNYKIDNISTFADRSHSNGGLYEQLGFEFIHKTQPNYYYIINKNRKHRFNFRKDVLVKEGFDKNMTEHEIMLSRDIFRIYDSGSLKYIWDNQNDMIKEKIFKKIR